MHAYMFNKTVIWITFTVSFLLLLIKLSHKTFYLILYTVEKLYKYTDIPLEFNLIELQIDLIGWDTKKSSDFKQVSYRIKYRLFEA